MVKAIKLTEDEKKTLLEYGYLDKDMWQIEEASKFCKLTTYKLNSDRPIKLTRKEAIVLLGSRELFIDGLARASFHYTSARTIPNTKYHVHFNCSSMFRKYDK